jgi:hypothetical protein
MQKIVFTCITNGIDQLQDPLIVSKDCKYICFTDKNIESEIWQCRPLLKSFNCPRLTARYHKTIGANEIESDVSIWQDGKIQFLRNHSHLFKQEFLIRKHPVRNCAYDEAIRVIHLKKDDPRIIKRQIKQYQKEGFPVKFGLYETSVVVRHRRFFDFNEKWWDEIKNNSIRDQISLPYIFWKLSITPKYIRDTDTLFETKEHPFIDYYSRIPLL